MKILLWSGAALAVALGSLMYATTQPAADVKPEPITTTAPVSRSIATTWSAPAAPTIEQVKPVDVSIPSQRTRLEDRFAKEQRDPTWATTAQQELHTDLGRFTTRDVGIRDIQCRASLCRIELALATRDAAPAFMEQWLYQRTWTGPGVADSDVLDDSGHPRLVMFVGKDGQEL